MCLARLLTCKSWRLWIFSSESVIVTKVSCVVFKTNTFLAFVIEKVKESIWTYSFLYVLFVVVDIKIVTKKYYCGYVLVAWYIIIIQECLVFIYKNSAYYTTNMIKMGHFFCTNIKIYILLNTELHWPTLAATNVISTQEYYWSLYYVLIISTLFWLYHVQTIFVWHFHPHTE